MLDRVKRLVQKKSRLGGVAALTAATALNQALSMLILPILARLYSPEDFGLAAYVGSILGVLLVCSGFRYELAVPLCKTNTAALNALSVSFFCLCCLLLVVFCSTYFVVIFKFGSLPLIGGDPLFSAILLAVGVFLGGGCQIAGYWAVRQRNYAVIAKTRFQQGLATSVFQFLFGFFSSGGVGLILGQVLGQGFGLIRLFETVLEGWSRFSTAITSRRLVWAAKRYRRFPLVDIWAALLNSTSALAPVFLFSSLFSVSLAGYYALSTRILSIPMSLIGSSVSQVILGQIAQHKEKGTLQDLILNVQRGLSAIAFVPMAVFAGLSPFVLDFAFGSQWAGAAPVAMWSSLWVAIQFVYVPLSMALIALEAQGKNFIFQLMLFLVRVASIFASYFFNANDLVVAAYSVGSAIVYVMGLYFICSEAKLSWSRAIGSLAVEALVAFSVFWILISFADLFWLSIAVVFVLAGYAYRVMKIKDRFLTAG